MHGELIPIYGSFAIHSFGVFLVLGLIIFAYCFLNNPTRSSIIDSETFMNMLSIGIVSGLCGGRILYCLTNGSQFFEFFFIWQGGISLLGALIAILCTIPFFLQYKRIPLVPFFDLAAVYAPLLQAIARIGCFFAGCCYGAPTQLAWGTSHITDLGQHIMVHPTQLYSAALLGGIFLIMKQFGTNKLNMPGLSTTLYLMLMSLERFSIDFLRADQEYFSHWALSWLSLHQWIALVIFSSAFMALIHISRIHHNTYRTAS